MIKKATIVTRRLLPLIKEDADFVQSVAYRSAIQVPYLIMDYMACRRFEQDYTGPQSQTMKRLLCAGWAENNSLRSAYESANRMEVHLEPFMGSHGIRVCVKFFKADNTQTLEITLPLNDKGYGGVGMSC